MPDEQGELERLLEVARQEASAANSGETPDYHWGLHEGLNLALAAIPNGWAKVGGRWVHIGTVVLDYWDAQWADGSGFLSEEAPLYGVKGAE